MEMRDMKNRSKTMQMMQCQSKMKMTQTMYDSRIKDQDYKTREVSSITKKLEEEEAALMHRLNTTMQKE